MKISRSINVARPALFTLFALPIPVIAALISFYYLGGKFPAGMGFVSNGTENSVAVRTDREAIASFIVSPAAVVGGKDSTATINLRHAAPAGGVVVSLSTTGAAQNVVPTQIVIPAGKKSASVRLQTKGLTPQRSLSITARSRTNSLNSTLTILPTAGAAWYVSPRGTKSGAGNTKKPWDLATALSNALVKPGDTIWLMGGNYTGTFLSTITGTPEQPIIVRSMPNERVIIDKSEVNSLKQPALKVKGSWVWFWGFEVMNSNTDRSRNSPYSGEDEPWRGSGVDVYAPNVKFINMIFHDNGQGIWDKEDMTEVHGCLFFYNGNNKREHALYIGNESGTKYITDNIVFDQAGYGILAFSNSLSSSQKGLLLEGNIAFNNGLLTADDQKTGNLQVGGVSGVSAERIVVQNNFVYNNAGNAPNKNYGIKLGYEDQGNKDVTLLDNYVVSARPLFLWWWQDVDLEGNTIYSTDDAVIDYRLPFGVTVPSYKWNFNAYMNTGVEPTFANETEKIPFGQWKQLFGFDLESQLRTPTGTEVFVRANRYEPGRANIVVFNWERRERVSVDLTQVLNAGAYFEILDSQNYFGEPVFRGTYSGGAVELPMGLVTKTRPVGNVERIPAHTGLEFGAYIVRLAVPPPTKKGGR